MMRSIAIALLLAAGLAHAQVPADRDALLKGEGAGQGSYAEMNGYPGPKRVLDMAPLLSITPEQKRRLTEVYKGMVSRARELGTRIVRVEDELNTAFRQGLVNERSVSDDAEQIGKLRGKLRAVFLAAHLKTKEILSREQLALYKSLQAKDGATQKNH